MIKGFTLHGSERVVERRARQRSIRNAVENPLKINPVKINTSRPSQRVIEESVTVVINRDTGKILTVYPTSTQRVRSLINQTGK